MGKDDHKITLKELSEMELSLAFWSKKRDEIKKKDKGALKEIDRTLTYLSNKIVRARRSLKYSDLDRLDNIE